MAGGFLGQFGNENVRLELEELPGHDVVTIALDLFIIRSWDGGPAQGDRWRMSVDGNRILNATFSNDDKMQSFPDDVPFGPFPGKIGATEENTLSYWFRTEDNAADAIYHIERTYLHDRAGLDLQFSGRNLHRVVLGRLAELLDENPELLVSVDGHTDSTDEIQANRDLSDEVLWGRLGGVRTNVRSRGCDRCRATTSRLRRTVATPDPTGRSMSPIP